MTRDMRIMQDILDALFARAPYDRLVLEWCDAKDRNDTERAREIEIGLAELSKASATPFA